MLHRMVQHFFIIRLFFIILADVKPASMLIYKIT